MTAFDPSEGVVDRVAELLHGEVGLRPESSLRGRLRRSIREGAGELGQDLDGYVRMLATSPVLRQKLLNRVTVQETAFFRHAEHFEVLARDLLPGLTPPVTFWSAGCANGQEAYSLAMVLEENGIAGSVIATDVSTAALHRTAAARYSAREITGLSPQRVLRHLTPDGASFEVNPSLRGRVRGLHHNLIDPLPEEVRRCQVVFCRNVLIYFSPQHARAFLDRLATALPAAWLFLGSAETIWSAGDRYETVRIGDTYAYRPLTVAGTAGRPAGARIPGVLPHVAAPARAALAPASVRPERGLSAAGPDAAADAASGAAADAAGGAASDAARGAAADAAGDAAAISRLAHAGQQALAAHDERSAVVSFRKWVYLAQDDALAHLHLALALEALGDQSSAQRAFGAARRALLEQDPGRQGPAIDGYATEELHRLLDAKQQEPPR